MTDTKMMPETVTDEALDQAQGGLVINLSVGLKEDAPAAEATNPTRFDPYKNFKFRVS